MIKALDFDAKQTKNILVVFFFPFRWILCVCVYNGGDGTHSFISIILVFMQFGTYLAWIEYSSIIIWIRNSMWAPPHLVVFDTSEEFFFFGQKRFVTNCTHLLLAFVFPTIFGILFVIRSWHNKQKLNTLASLSRQFTAVKKKRKKKNTKFHWCESVAMAWSDHHSESNLFIAHTHIDYTAQSTTIYHAAIIFLITAPLLWLEKSGKALLALLFPPQKIHRIMYR